MIGCDIRAMDNMTFKLLSNKEVIAVNQGTSETLLIFPNKSEIAYDAIFGQINLEFKGKRLRRMEI